MKIYLILIILFLGTCRGSDNRTDLQSQNEIRLSCIDKSLCLVLDEYIRAHPEFNILTLTTNVDTIDFTFNIKGLSHKRPYMILGPAAERGGMKSMVISGLIHLHSLYMANIRYLYFPIWTIWQIHKLAVSCFKEKMIYVGSLI